METYNEVRARRFVLVDDAGKPTAYLSSTEAGNVGLHVGNASAAVTIGVNDDGMPTVTIMREGGAVSMFVAPDGKAVIHLEDADGTKRAFDTGGAL